MNRTSSCPRLDRAVAAGTTLVLACLALAALPKAASAADREPAAAPNSVLRGAAASAIPADASQRVAPGTKVTIRGKGPKRIRVALQRKDGNRWRALMRQHTDARGRYVFRFAAPARTTTYRVKAVAGRWVSKRRTIRVRPPAPGPAPAERVGTLSAPTSTEPETVLPVTATFVPATAGRPVTLEARVAGGAWSVVAQGVQDAAGQTLFTVRPSATTTYRAVAAAVPGSPAMVSPDATIALRPARTRPWVTAYYAGWFWNTGHLAPTEIDWGSLTHFVLGRATPGGGATFGGEPGTVVPAAGNVHEPSPWAPYHPLSVEDWLVQEAHRHGKPALLMLGGDGEAGAGFLASTRTPEIRQRFAKNIVDYLVEHDYDGVDVDWENCLTPSFAGCGEEGVTEQSATSRLKALLLDIRAEMATRARYRATPGIITFPHYALNTNFLQPGGKAKQWQADVAAMVDQFNLMSYGVGTTWNGSGWKSWFSGALDGERSDGHPVSIDSSAEVYQRTGVPRSRIGMGIGFFGTYYGPSITGPRQSTEGNAIFQFNDVALQYSALVRMGYLANGGEVEWDEEAKSSYITYDEEYGPAGYTPVPPAGQQPREPAGFLTFEDPRSIAAKGEYTWQTGLGGTIIWAMNYGELADGASPLMDAVRDSFIVDPRGSE